MKFISLFIFIVVQLFSLDCISQRKITGKIIDEKSNAPIPFAHITLIVSQSGTITNTNGEFELVLPTEKDTFLITHISYENEKVLPTAELDIIKLKPKTVLLKEVVVNDLANQYIKKIYNTGVSRLNEKNYGKAFYRQLTFNDSIPNEIQEVFYALETNNAGIVRESIEEARYAQKKRAEKDSFFIHFGNFSQLILSTQIISTKDKKEILIPLMNQSEKFYDFSIVDETRDEYNEYIKIHFEPLPEYKHRATEGDLIFNPATNHVLRMDFVLRHSLKADHLKRNGKEYNLVNHIYKFSLDFNKDGKLNYILGSLNFDAVYGNEFINHTLLNASLVVYQQNLEPIRHLEQANLKKNDIAQLRKKKYNPAFWKENPIVKKTPLEEKIFSKFETDGSFGTLFNSANP